MRLVDSLKGVESYYLLISGNGKFPENVIFKNLCEKFNGYQKAVFFISTPIKKQTGLDALNAIPIYPKKFQINSFIFIVDGEHIRENARNEIQRHLESKGMEINEIIPLKKAFLIRCNSGPYSIILFCIILGPEVFIEEEVAKLIELKLGITIDLSRKREPVGRKEIKKNIKQILRENGKTLDELVRSTGKTKLQETFPNICAVLEKIEEHQ